MAAVGTPFVNVVTVALLLVIALGFWSMPRMNYGVLATRIANLETTSASLEQRFSKGAPFLREGSASRRDRGREPVRGRVLR